MPHHTEVSFENAGTLLTLRSLAFVCFTRPLDVEGLQESQENMCQLNTSWSLVLIFVWEMFAMESRDTGLSIMGCCANQKYDCKLQVL